MGTLKVNRITGMTGVTGQEPIVMSGDTVSLGNNSMSINGTGVTMSSGTIGPNASFPSGTIIQRKQYKSTTSQDFSGTAVYTSIGNPIVFNKKKDASTTKLIFHSWGYIFTSVGNHFAINVRLRTGTTATGGTELGIAQYYDLFHSTASPWRTGRHITMLCDENVSLGVGDHNFVIAGERWGYDNPQAISQWILEIYEIVI